MELTTRQRYLLVMCVEGELDAEHHGDTKLTEQEERNLPGYSADGEHDESFYQNVGSLRSNLRSELRQLRALVG